VIVSYRDKRTEQFATGERVKAFSGIERPARLKLDRLETATAIGDLAALPGNRFENLKGDRKVNAASASMTNGGSALSGRLDRPAL
jgi:proteic killer suppression protein